MSIPENEQAGERAGEQPSPAESRAAQGSIEMIDTPRRGRMGAVALVFGIAAVTVPVLVILLSAISVAVQNTDLAMATAFFFVPLCMLIAAILGIVAIILALVYRPSSPRGDRRWFVSLLLGIAGTLLLPIALTIVTLTTGGGA